MKVAIRTDASLAIGTGHVERCLTLADRLRAAGADITFLCRPHAGHSCERIAARGYAVVRLAEARAQPDTGGHHHWLGATWEDDAVQTLAAMPPDVEWLIVDHYALDARWERAVRPGARRIMAIDDLADRPHACDLLLDQNMAAGFEERYEALVPIESTKLLGPTFALLRPEFALARAGLRERDGTVRRVFVFLGGADGENQTGKVLDALAGHDLEVDVVIGGSNPNRAALERQCAALPNARLHCQVSNIAELMAASDLAIGAGGGAMWERCCLGLPSIVIGVASNQDGGSTEMARQGRVLYLGAASHVDSAMIHHTIGLALASPPLLQYLARASHDTVDGGGAARVARALLAERHISLRAATASDCDDLWTWRNADIVRRFSGNSEAIPIEQHRHWFHATLSNPDRSIVLGEVDGHVAGVLRYDREGQVATISIYLTPDFIGQGLGRALIERGSEWIAQHWADKVDTIHARVMAGNQASRAAFVGAGFSEHSTTFAKRITPSC
ncbi:MAG: UDP-2,4-diacetamido-2,4,6-trideoxy-beta-L-altropyranose hydrolase [Pseudomonadota bacterium]